MTTKYIHQFKKGDIVRAHGGLFRITSDAKDSNSHRPMAGHLKQAHGPSDCAWAESVCIEGKCGHYFEPGSSWTFQGNFHAGKYTLAS